MTNNAVNGLPVCLPFVFAFAFCFSSIQSPSNRITNCGMNKVLQSYLPTHLNVHKSSIRVGGGGGAGGRRSCATRYFMGVGTFNSQYFLCSYFASFSYFQTLMF